MYKPIDKLQHSFLDFNQPMGLHMNPDNHWVKLADLIPWDEFEVKYARLFPSDAGNVAKPLRMVLGALIIQARFWYSDRELVEQIAENPYLQYFIAFSSFQEEAPFDASTLVLFRKRISAEMLMEVNEYLLDHKNISYPQDISLLSEAREKLETSFIDFVNVIVLSYPEDTANVLEKSISRLLKAESTRQRKSAVHTADRSAT